MTLGPVRVMGAGMIRTVCAEEVHTHVATYVYLLRVIYIYACFKNCKLKVMMFVSLPTVRCPLLTNPVDGMIDCSLGDDGVPSFEDTCSLTCNTGYELTGSDTRTCQSDGSWSDIDSVCRRGTNIAMYVYFIIMIICGEMF